MECLALHESSSNEQYWANASHFWFCCQILGFPFHANLSTELKSSPKPNLDRYKSYFDNEVLTSLLKVCKTLLRVCCTKMTLFSFIYMLDIESVSKG